MPASDTLLDAAVGAAENKAYTVYCMYIVLCCDHSSNCVNKNKQNHNNLFAPADESSVFIACASCTGTLALLGRGLSGVLSVSSTSSQDIT